MYLMSRHNMAEGISLSIAFMEGYYKDRSFPIISMTRPGGGKSLTGRLAMLFLSMTGR